jgi:ribosomal-protein-alanine N-acetyltransferase
MQIVQRRIKTEEERGFAALLIFLKETGEFIGSGGIQPVRDTTDVEIAYHFLPSAWGKGYATETAKAILDFAFKSANLQEIVGVAFPDNMNSWRVLEKIGMQYVGIVRYHDIDGLKKYVANRLTWAASSAQS